MRIDPCKAGRWLIVLIALGVSGCATVPPERSAPCKRPANALAYGPPDIRADCGPMAAINGDPSAALAAIQASQI
jgi:hypothetical protein